MLRTMDLGLSVLPGHSSSDKAVTSLAVTVIALAIFSALLSFVFSSRGRLFCPALNIAPRHSDGLWVLHTPLHFPPVSGQHQYHFLLLCSLGFFNSSGFGGFLCHVGRNDFFLSFPSFFFSSFELFPFFL